MYSSYPEDVPGDSGGSSPWDDLLGQGPAEDVSEPENREIKGVGSTDSGKNPGLPLGIAGLLCSLAGIFRPAAIAGIVLSSLGLARSRKKSRKNIPAVLGIIIGLLWLLLWLLIALFGSKDKKTTDDEAAATPTPAQVEIVPADEESIHDEEEAEPDEAEAEPTPEADETTPEPEPTAESGTAVFRVETEPSPTPEPTAESGTAVFRVETEPTPEPTAEPTPEPTPAVSSVLSQVVVETAGTADGDVCVFITNNSSSVIDCMDVRVDYYDADDSVVDSETDTVTGILPGNVAVSRLDAPDAYSYLEPTVSVGFGRVFADETLCDDVSVDTDADDDGITVRLTNNSDAAIENLGFEILFYRDDQLCAVFTAGDVYDISAGDTVTARAGTDGIDYDAYEVCLTPSRTSD